MLKYREMTEEDCKEVAILEKENFEHPWSFDSLIKEVHNESSVFITAVSDGKVAGYAGMYIVCDEGDITNIVVGEDYRGKGIASGMMDYLIQKADSMKINDMTLEVRVSNLTAIHLYEKFGFVSEGIRPGFYDSPNEDAMIMWRRGVNNYH